MSSLELLARILILALPPSISIIARFEDVSTTEGIEGIILITPLWHAYIALTKLSCISSGTCLAGVGTSSAKNSICSSMCLNSLMKSFSQSLTNAFTSSTFSLGIVITTSALGGIAFLMLPPCQEARRTSQSSIASRRKRTISLLALARPMCISKPE